MANVGASKALHMNLFILIAGLLMAPVLLATLVGWICIFWFERKKSWKSRLAKVGLATVPFAFCMWAYAVVFGPLDITEPQALRNAYETALGSPPASDVTDLRCRVSFVGVLTAEDGDRRIERTSLRCLNRTARPDYTRRDAAH